MEPLLSEATRGDFFLPDSRMLAQKNMTFAQKTERAEGKSVGQIEGENKPSGKVIPRSGVLSSRRPTQHRRHCADIVERIEGTKIGIIAIVRPIDGPKAVVSVFRRLSLVRWPRLDSSSDASFSEDWFVRRAWQARFAVVI